MMCGNSLRMMLIALACFPVTGCMPKMTIEKLKAMTPQRPVELDQLEAIAGTWETFGDINIFGLHDILKVSGETVTAWDADRWAMVEHASLDVDDLGAMAYVATWTWDFRRKCFRRYACYNNGTCTEGTVRPTKGGADGGNPTVWRIKTTSSGPHPTTTGTGTMRFVDEATIEWTWTDRVFLGLIRVAEIKGTSVRKE